MVVHLRIKKPCRRRFSPHLIILLKSRRNVTSRISRHLTSCKAWKILKKRLKRSRTTLSISRQELLFTFRIRMTQRTESWRNTSTIIQTGKSLRLCLWGNLRVYMSSDHAESSWKLNVINSRSRSEEDSWASMSSSTSTRHRSWRNWRGEIHSKNSQRKSCFKRQLLRKMPGVSPLRLKADLQAHLQPRRRRR